jgi:hypothetical protein
MTKLENQVQKLNCRCGRVTLEFRGDPIVTTVCHCASCQQAGKQLAALPGAETILDASDGTAFILFRKDRVRCLNGENLLAEHRLNATTTTRRVVATCCNTAMFLDFTRGHWISLYSARVPQAYRQFTPNKSVLFVPKLMWAWLLMGFRTPKIDYVKGVISDAKA